MHSPAWEKIPDSAPLPSGLQASHNRIMPCHARGGVHPRQGIQNGDGTHVAE
jgi:hypothetical protein